MTPDQIQQKIFFGYAKAAYKLGSLFNLYRSATPINPIASGNLIGQVQMSTSVAWNYLKANSYGNAVWNACLDAQSSSSPLNCRVGDYLVPNDAGGDNSTYFVQVLQFDLPPRVVKCNRTISVIRPSQSTGPGYVGYEGYQPSTSAVVMTAMPASILKIGHGGSAPTKLPTDTNEPLWTILIPNLGNVTIRIDDIITDDIGEEYVVSVNELTELGWRIEAIQVVNSR